MTPETATPARAAPMSCTSVQEERKPRTAIDRLKNEIVVIVVIKVAIVLLAAFFVFGADQRPQIDTEALQRQFLNHPDRSRAGA